MKYILILIFSLVIISLHAQTYPSPDFTNEPAYYDSTTHTITSLEKSHYNKLSQAKGLMGKEGGFFLDHAKSPVRVKAAPVVYFLVMVQAGGNPSSIFDFTSFEVRGDERVLITSKLSKAGTKNTTSFERISFGMKKVGDGLYLLSVPSLPAGEYLFGSHDNMFAFGIDN